MNRSTFGVLVALVLLTFKVDANAQKSAHADSRLSVLSMTLDVHNVTDLDFGEVTPTEQQTVTVDPMKDAEAASFVVTGHPNQFINVRVSATNLQNEDGVEIPMTVDWRGSKKDNQQSANNGRTKLSPQRGEYYIWVGGSVEVDKFQDPGLYEGTVTVKAEYF